MRWVFLSYLHILKPRLAEGRMDSRVVKEDEPRMPWLKTSLTFQALCPWANYLNSLGLSFFICTVGVITAPMVNGT